jgi:hypothetical protein
MHANNAFTNVFDSNDDIWKHVALHRMLFLCQLFHFQKPEWRGLKQLQRGKTFIVQNLDQSTVIY